MPSGKPGWTARRALGIAAVKRAHYVLSQILADAGADNLIPKNPAAGLTLPKTSLQAACVPDPPAGGHSRRWGGGSRPSGTDARLHGPALGQGGRPASGGSGPAAQACPDPRERRAIGRADACRHAQGPQAVGRALPEFLVPLLARQREGRKCADLLFGDGEYLRRPHAVSAGPNVKAAQRMLGHASAAMTLDVDTSSATTWRPRPPRSIKPTRQQRRKLISFAIIGAASGGRR